MNNAAKLISITPDAEQTMAYVARVSNPSNQDNPNYAGLLKYCINHKHMSVFEQATMTIEVKTIRAISAQILRHRSFTFQEFSGRYSAVTDPILVPDLRLQDTKNRQNSIEVEDEDTKRVVEGFQKDIEEYFSKGLELYQDMLDFGVAKECARNILPMCSPTTIYMTGNVRSWMHYIELRSANGTQKEHQEVALACKEIFKQQLPVVSEALGWG